MESLKAFGKAVLDLLTAFINALGTVLKNHPKFSGIVSIVSLFFIACMVSEKFMDFAAQVIALLIMGWLGYIIFFKKKEEKPKPPQNRNNRRRYR